MNIFKNLGKNNIIIISVTLLICLLITGATAFTINQNNSQNSNTSSSSTSLVSSGFTSSSLESSKSNSINPVSSSSPSSVATNSSSSSSISSSVSSSVISTAPAQPVKKQLNYKNPFFENYNIVYPEDWKFSTVTYDSFDDLIGRTVTLTKNNVKISFNTTPTYNTGCSSPFEEPEYSTTTKIQFDNNIKRETERYNGTESVYYIYKNAYPFCTINSQLISNLNIKNFPEYRAANIDNGSNTVNYFFNINTENLYPTDSKMIAEVDEIIKNSSFAKFRNF